MDTCPTVSPRLFATEAGPLISVIVPAWNAARYLPACLDSLLAQTQEGIEIIVIDDGSSDDTPQLLADYAQRHRQIRVERQPNLGVSAARNRGLDLARGGHIAFVDADDVAEPGLYRELLARSRREHLDIAVCNAWAYHPDGGRQTVFPAQFDGVVRNGSDWLVAAVRARALRHYIWCHLYRREFLVAQRLRFEPGISHQDIVWTNQALLAAARVAFIDQPLYHYLQHPGSLSAPQSSSARLHAALHYLQVTRLLDQLSCRHLSDDAVCTALRTQVIGEGLAIFKLAGQLPASQRRQLYAQLRAAGFMQRLWRNAGGAGQRRRILQRSLNYALDCAGLRLQWPLNASVGRSAG